MEWPTVSIYCADAQRALSRDETGCDDKKLANALSECAFLNRSRRMPLAPSLSQV
jgi:hypothetical protein